MIKLTHTSYIVLGLVEQAGSATPYELKRMLAASVGNFWSVPHSQMYAEPQRLAAGGYLSERQERGGRRRRTYSLTQRGRRALAAWRDEVPYAQPELRDLALLKLFFGGDPKAIAPAQLAAHRQKLAEYREVKNSLAEPLLASGPARVLEAGIGHEREWVAFWKGLTT